jgi:uncharacterized delta-60 repeat protein
MMRRSRTTVVQALAIAGILACTTAAHAGPGDIDRSFGGDGKASPDLSGRDLPDEGAAVAVQDDGRIVVAGYLRRRVEDRGIRTHVAVARFRVRGVLDRSFAGDGIKVVNLRGWSDFSAGVAIDRRDRIVVAANTGITDEMDDTYSWDSALIRLRPDGRLDRRFSGDGLLVDPSLALAKDLSLLPDGKVVVAGTGFEPDDGSPLSYPSDFAAIRYTRRGKPDTSFGEGGRVVTDLGSADDEASAVDVADDGAIVVGGTAGGDFALVRYLPGGDPDASFSDDGIQTTNVLTYDEGTDLAIQADGKIVLVGAADPAASGDHRDFALARYLGDGQLDPGFWEDGVRTISRGDFDLLSSVALQSDGKIVVGGSLDTGDDWDDFAVARLRPGGALDRRFGRAGIRTTMFETEAYDSAQGLALDGRGRIVLAGDTSSRRSRDVAVARYRGG